MTKKEVRDQRSGVSQMGERGAFSVERRAAAEERGNQTEEGVRQNSE